MTTSLKQIVDAEKEAKLLLEREYERREKLLTDAKKIVDEENKKLELEFKESLKRFKNKTFEEIEKLNNEYQQKKEVLEKEIRKNFVKNKNTIKLELIKEILK